MSDYLINMVNQINSDFRWRILEEMYNNFKKKEIKEDKIPKIIHQIWLGGEIPKRYDRYIEKLKRINTNWEYKLWTDNDIESFGLKNKVLFNNIKNLGAKSDILRYEILERIGGLYVDVDFDFIKPFDDLCHLDFFAGNGHVDAPEVFNSIMASTPNHKYVAKLVSELQKKETFNDDINGVMNNTGPYFVTKVFFSTCNVKDNVAILPTKYLFPFPAVYRHNVSEDQKSQEFIYSFLNENSYCLHLWHTNWQK